MIKTIAGDSHPILVGQEFNAGPQANAEIVRLLGNPRLEIQDGSVIYWPANVAVPDHSNFLIASDYCANDAAAIEQLDQLGVTGFTLETDAGWVYSFEYARQLYQTIPFDDECVVAAVALDFVLRAENFGCEDKSPVT